VGFMRDLRFWRWRRAQNEDIDRELEVHLDLAAAERFAAGVPPPEAHRVARREFGSLALTKEDLRGMRTGAALARLLSQAVRDFRYGLRLLWRAPGFSAVERAISTATRFSVCIRFPASIRPAWPPRSYSVNSSKADSLPCPTGEPRR
jgi:hypothetical protein